MSTLRRRRITASIRGYQRSMFVFARRVPFGGVWGWHAGLGHPILKLLGLIVALLVTVVLAVLAVLAVVIDIVLLPFRLLL